MPPDASGGVCTRCALEQVLAPVLDEAGAGALVLADIPKPGTKFGYIGDYELLEVIAHGGMGVVYKARQRGLNRLVALKLLLGGAHASADFKRRFQREAELAARLQHPNIVPIFEVGEHEGQLFFSMEYVAGPDLGRLVREQPLSPTRAAEYVKTLAEAVHDAHLQGVLHRDIKPSNILISPDGRPRITDFGLARQADLDSSLTLSGAILGIPGYLPPEQVSPKYGPPGPYSDIYSLGALLFHLLTGRAPFLASTVPEALRQVLESEPVPPRRLNASVQGDLETICLKCLEKAPQRRYQSARQLAEDLGRWLAGEPILARPVTAAGRAWKWAKRRPAQAGLLLSLAVLLTLAAVTTILQVEKKRATAQALNLSAAIKLGRAETEFDRGDPLAGLRQIAAAAEIAPFSRVAVTRLLWALSYRNYLLPALCLRDSPGNRLVAARFTPDGRRVVTLEAGGELRAWEAHTGNANSPAQTNNGSLQCNALVLSPDGSLSLALGITTNTPREGFARLWPIDTDPATSRWLTDTQAFVAGCFTADSRGIWLAAEDGTAALWETATGARLRQIRPEDRGEAVALSPRADYFACAGRQSNVWVYATATSRLSKLLPTSETVTALAFDHLGRRLMAASKDGRVRVWEWQAGSLLSESPAFGSLAGACISPDGARVLLLTKQATLLLNTTNLTATIKSYPPSHLTDASPFSPDSRQFSLCDDRRIRVWDSDTGNPFAEPADQGWVVEDATFSPDGRRLATAFSKSLVTIYDLQKRAAIPPLRQVDFPMEKLVSTTDGRWAATVQTNTVRLWELLADRNPALELAQATNVTSVAISPGAQRLAVATTNRMVLVWNIRRGQAQLPSIDLQDDIEHLRFSQDERHLLIIGRTRASILDCQPAQPNTRLVQISAAPIPDAQWGATPQFDGEFSPDGRRAIVVWGDGYGHLVAVSTGQRLHLLPHNGPVWRAHFSPEGRRVVTASIDGTARVWDAASGRDITQPLRHPLAVFDARFSPDGKRVVTVCLDRSSRIWDSHTGRLLAESHGYSGGVLGCEISPDGMLFGTYSDKKVVQFWDMETGLPVSDLVPAAPTHSGCRSEIRFLQAGRSALVMNPGGYRHYSIPQPPMPAPDWLSELAGLLASDAAWVTDEDNAASALLRLRQRLEHLPGQDFYAEWARWFFADPERRSKTMPFGRE